MLNQVINEIIMESLTSTEKKNQINLAPQSSGIVIFHLINPFIVLEQLHISIVIIILM